MAAPAMSYLICSMGLVVLILVMPYVYSIERDNVVAQIAEAELAEIADYTSNTLENLYFLADSSNQADANLTKELLYLPSTVQESFYRLTISSAGLDASKVTASLKDKSSFSADSWLIPGLRVSGNYTVEINNKSIVAGCYRNITDGEFYVSLGYGV